MAAPDAKASPSNKEIQPTTEIGAVAAAGGSSEVASGLVTKEAPAPAASNNEMTTIKAIPTYETSETSEKYILAKSLLSSGDFEQSLEVIEEAIQETRQILGSLGLEDSDLHESMAPFHYLYGTTLLYSIEESNDTQMTVAQTDEDVVVDAEAPREEDPDTDNNEEAPNNHPSSNDDSNGEDDDDDNNNNNNNNKNNAPVEPNVEDMEIAWENLDTARNIVDAMLTDSKERTETEMSKLQLDLAQILLREGDLQRMNGRYSEAILDYEACLIIRQRWLPPFDRKIADAQYNLGLSYLSNSTDLQKQENPDEKVVSLAQDHCQKGVQLYLDCSYTLCGQMASLCAVDPHTTIFLTTEGEEGKAGLKTTGMSEADIVVSNASQTLTAWRNAVASLKPIDGEEDDPLFVDLKELLDEIQETIDEAQRSQQAVREASQLKHQAQKSLITLNEDGATTQIGFGQATLTPVVEATTTASDKPMMIVKKKKKRDDDNATELQVHEAKRTKTE
jgi:tetratricopeptide (TPR) repeat protein